MNDRQRPVWTPSAVRALGVRTDIATAGDILGGLCRAESYRLHAEGRFPVPVIRVGRRLVVPVAPILELMCVGPPETAVAGAAPPAAATTPTDAPIAIGAQHDDTPGAGRRIRAIRQEGRRESA